MPCWPSRVELEQFFLQKYGKPEEVGWAPRRRFRFGYYLPADIYEVVVGKLIGAGCAWIDVGGGRHVFPENPTLARLLVSRCSTMVAVDPSENVRENEFVHRREQCLIEDYHPDGQFDLASLRMVVEHVEQPEKVVQALARLLRPGGVAIVLTVNRWSPITMLSRFTPFGLHHPIKKLIWGGEEHDTFPVRYLMNTRHRLRHLFEAQGFQEVEFAFLDDLSAFGLFRGLNLAELAVWRLLKRFGLRYPENCLLGIYQRRPGSTNRL